MNYHGLPEHMQGAARRYVKHGIRPGDFLTAVLCNDFKEAFALADSVNTACMKAWAMWIYNEAPSLCHGSPELVQAWIKRGGLQGNGMNSELESFLAKPKELTDDDDTGEYELSRGD